MRRRMNAERHATLHIFDLGQARGITCAAVEARAHKGAHQVIRKLNTDDAPAQDKHVHVIMFDPLTSRVCIMRDAGANSKHLVRSNAGAHTTSANDNATLSMSLLQRFTDISSEIRVVRTLIVVRAKIQDIMPVAQKQVDYRLLEREPGMVGCNGQFHNSQDYRLLCVK